MLGASVVAARHDHIPRRSNGLPGGERAARRLYCPFGRHATGEPGGGHRRRGDRGVAYRSIGGAVAVVAAAMKLVVERVVRARMATFLAVRQRPGAEQPNRCCGATCPPRTELSVGPRHPGGGRGLRGDDLCRARRRGCLHLAALVMVGRVYVGPTTRST